MQLNLQPIKTMCSLYHGTSLSYKAKEAYGFLVLLVLERVTMSIINTLATIGNHTINGGTITKAKSTHISKISDDKTFD